MQNKETAYDKLYIVYIYYEIFRQLLFFLLDKSSIRHLWKFFCVEISTD